jgi:hypothetical protein
MWRLKGESILNKSKNGNNSTFLSAPHMPTIMEKPSAAQIIAAVLNATQKKDGYV